MLFLLVSCVSGLIRNAKTDKSAKPVAVNSQSTTATTTIKPLEIITEPAVTTPPVDKKNVIYLSPSNQWDNFYTGVETTEADEMHDIANRVQAQLEAAGYTVYIAPPETDMDLREKIQYGLQHNIGTYVAIHSNAGGGEGTEIFCNTARPASQQLADIMLEHVGAVTPSDDRGVFDGGENLGEVMSPLVDTVPTCLIEVEFPDR
jgi:N-acetylmuramoyl-L-alanine amidase